MIYVIFTYTLNCRINSKNIKFMIIKFNLKENKVEAKDVSYIDFTEGRKVSKNVQSFLFRRKQKFPNFCDNKLLHLRIKY